MRETFELEFIVDMEIMRPIDFSRHFPEANSTPSLIKTPFVTFRQDNGKFALIGVRAVYDLRIVRDRDERWVSRTLAVMGDEPGHLYTNNIRTLINASTVPKVDFYVDVLRLRGNGPISLSGLANMQCCVLTIDEPCVVSDGLLSALRCSCLSHIKVLPDISGPNVKPFNPPVWLNIINDHLRGEKDILACQEELIDAGFEDLATL